MNSAISWLNRADRPSSVGKLSHLPFQILSFSFAPNEPLAGHGASGTNFFERQGLRASLTQTLINEEPSRAPQKTLKRFTNTLFF